MAFTHYCIFRTYQKAWNWDYLLNEPSATLNIHAPQQGSIPLAERENIVGSAVKFVLKVWISFRSTDILGNNLNVTWILYLNNSDISTQLNGVIQEYIKRTCVHKCAPPPPQRTSTAYHQFTACAISCICPHLESQLSFRFSITFSSPIHSSSQVATLLTPTSTGKLWDFFKTKCRIYDFTAFI